MTSARRRLAIAMLALVALVGVVYGPAVDGPYLWDDHVLIERDERDEANPPPLDQLFLSPFFVADPLSDARPPYFRPLTTLSLRVDRALLREGPFGHHLSNIVLHIVAALLLVVIARRLGAGSVASILAATAWALAPRLTEAVAWCSGRPELLAGALSFAAIASWPFLPGVATPRRAWWRVVVGLGLLAAALLAKEIAVAALFALFVATLLAEGTRAERARRAGVLLVPLVGYVALRTLALARAPHTSVASTGAGTVLETAGRYGAMVLDPWRPATSIGLVGELDARFVIFGAATIAAALVLALFTWRRRAKASRGAIVAAALGLAGLVPVLQIVPIGLGSAVAADRLLYFPLAGLVLALAVLASRLPARLRLPAAAITAALALSFAFVTRSRSEEYRSDLVFWLVAAEHAHPRNTAPRSALANTVRSHGFPEIACKLHASTIRILAASGRSGTTRYGRAVENLASCDALIGRPDEAIAMLRGLLVVRPELGRAYMGLGFAELQLMAFDDAEASFRHALALEPALAIAGDALSGLPQTRLEAARLGTEDARRVDPLGWARLMMRVGRVADADHAWLDLALDPETPPPARHESIRALMSLNDIVGARRVLVFALDNGDPIPSMIDWQLTSEEIQRARVVALSGRLAALY